MNKQMLKSGLRFLLVNVLKLSGWQVYLAIHTFDLIWSKVIIPLYNDKKAWNDSKNRANRRKNMVEHLKNVTKDDDMIKQTKKFWEIVRSKENA